MRTSARTSKPAEAGFTLVEMLVAMLLLSLVGLTLARFQTFQLAGTSGLASAAGARLLADNIAVDLLVSPEVPTAPEEGEVNNAGRSWRFRVTPGPSPDPAALPDLVSFEIAVLGPDGETVASRSIVRRQGELIRRPGAVR